jgi:hypothetical protein
MSQSESESQDSIESRTERALTECMTVLPNKGRADGAPDLFIVVGENENGEYLADTRTATCECADDEYNLGDQEACKHVRRARIATGDRPVPASALETGNISIDDTFGAHVDASPKFATADGGIIDGETGDVLQDEDDRVNTDLWSAPRPEVDKHGRPTGAYYVKCFECGVEVLQGQQGRSVHREGCSQ